MTALLERDREQQRAGLWPWRAAVRLAFEAALMAGLYLLYARVRDLHGTASAAHASVARAHGLALARLEHLVHLDVEHSVQAQVLGHGGLVRALDGWYGGAHFAVTLLALLTLAVRGGATYRRWRRVLVLGTALGVAVFAWHATMPPRLLPAPYATVDTLHVYGGLWSYDDGSLERIADPYAALPSLHLVWAGWCTLVGLSVLRRPVLRALAVLYPCVTTWAVLATGNHFLLDVLAGLAVLAVATGIVLAAERQRGRLRGRGAG